MSPRVLASILAGVCIAMGSSAEAALIDHLWSPAAIVQYAAGIEPPPAHCGGYKYAPCPKPKPAPNEGGWSKYRHKYNNVHKVIH